MGSRMKSGLNRPLKQMARGLVLSTMLTGCLYGQNQQFFDYGSSSSGNEDDNHPGSGNGGSTGGSTSGGSTGGTSGGSTGGVDPQPTPVATPVATATPEPTPVVVVTPTPAASPSPSATPVATATPSPTPVVVVTPTPAQVCDPIGGGDGSGSSKNGIKGKLYSYEDSALKAHPYSGVADFFKWGTQQNVDLFLSNLFTPTRAFDSGFMTSDGQLLKKSNGDLLFEYFALKLSGGIQLPKGAANKKVQFAILSDDGARLRMLMAKPGDAGVTIVNNDGDHATRMGCASLPVQVSADGRVPFELDYYQGPRMHIALILLWREYKDGMSMNDKWCGQSGNDLFFDSNYSPSKPLSAYNDLMNRWEVVPSSVFYIDGFGNTNTDVDNPCLNK